MNSKTVKKKKIGKIFEIGERTFYPVVEISTVEMEFISFLNRFLQWHLLFLNHLKDIYYPLLKKKLIQKKSLILYFQNKKIDFFLLK